MKLEYKKVYCCLEALRDDMLEISSGWNGKDEKYTVNGELYTEEDADHAVGIVEKCNELLKLLGE